jgi:hypothetical protein
LFFNHKPSISYVLFVCLFLPAGELSEYVTSELNVLALDTCSDPLAYAELSAVPDWQGLGKRLGKDMGKVRMRDSGYEGIFQGLKNIEPCCCCRQRA